jgi:hypothetical protein
VNRTWSREREPNQKGERELNQPNQKGERELNQPNQCKSP